MPVEHLDPRIKVYPGSVSVEIAEAKTCDIHHYDLGEPGVTAHFDGKTKSGPWANMCTDHMISHGLGVGTGYGQELICVPSRPQYKSASEDRV